MRAHRLGGLRFGGTPFAELDQRLGQVHDRNSQMKPHADPAQVPGGGAGGLGGGRGIGKRQDIGQVERRSAKRDGVVMPGRARVPRSVR